MANAIDILNEDPTEAVEEDGELTYTEKQLGVVRGAVENPEASPGDLDDMGVASETYIRSVLERADSDEAQRELNGADFPDEEVEDDEVEDDKEMEEADFDEEEAQTSAKWQGHTAELVEVSALEWCDECQERHQVQYLVPASAIAYLSGPPCGNPGRYANKEHIDVFNESQRRLVERLAQV